MKKVPVYLEFIKNLYERLIKDEILVETDEGLDFKLVEKLADLEEVDCNPSVYYSSRTRRIILDSIKNNADVSIKELREKTGYSDRIIRKHLEDLCQEGYIEKFADRNRTYYILKHE